MRPIDADALAAKCQEIEQMEHNRKTAESRWWALAYRVFYEMVTNAPTIDTQRWIPASEPPKESGEYIVMIRGATFTTTLFFSTISKAWYEFDDDERENPYTITHWMQLPEGPKEEICE